MCVSVNVRVCACACACVCVFDNIEKCMYAIVVYSNMQICNYSNMQLWKIEMWSSAHVNIKYECENEKEYGDMER